MRSRIADEVDAARREVEARMTVDKRVRWALELGERDVRTYAQASGITVREAWLRLREAEQNGRTPSGAATFRRP